MNPALRQMRAFVALAKTEAGHERYPLLSQMIDDLDGALANIADHGQLRKDIVRASPSQLMAGSVTTTLAYA